MIPAGIVDKNIEAFALNNHVMIMENGRCIPLRDSIDAIQLFREDMEMDAEVVQRIVDRGIVDQVEQVESYVTCRYGHFDERADITPDGIAYPEYWDCGKHGKCCDEGIVCLLPCGPNGRLTPREIDVVKLVAQDLADKQIADRLEITHNTVNVHRAHILHKLGCASKSGITRWAVENNIL